MNTNYSNTGSPAGKSRRGATIIIHFLYSILHTITSVLCYGSITFLLSIGICIYTLLTGSLNNFVTVAVTSLLLAAILLRYIANGGYSYFAILARPLCFIVCNIVYAAVEYLVFRLWLVHPEMMKPIAIAAPFIWCLFTFLSALYEVHAAEEIPNQEEDSSDWYKKEQYEKQWKEQERAYERSYVNQTKTLHFFTGNESPEEAKQKFRTLAKKYHPDNPNSGNKMIMQQVRAEYELVKQMGV